MWPWLKYCYILFAHYINHMSWNEWYLLVFGCVYLWEGWLMWNSNMEEALLPRDDVPIRTYLICTEISCLLNSSNKITLLFILTIFYYKASLPLIYKDFVDLGDHVYLFSIQIDRSSRIVWYTHHPRRPPHVDSNYSRLVYFTKPARCHDWLEQQIPVLTTQYVARSAVALS